jgi:hypothetical protein
MAATMTHQYPLALERIVRGFARNILNPATILISLDNHYVNDGWLTQQGSRLVTCGSTHGALDDLNSDGILLSNFTPTPDTSSERVAGLFGGFPGLSNYRAAENGAEWVAAKEQSLARIARVPFDQDFSRLPGDRLYLRIWSPRFLHFDNKVPVAVAIEKIPRFSAAEIRRGNHKPAEAVHQHLTFDLPISLPEPSAGERIYALPPDLILEPQTEYKISGKIQEQKKTVRLFAFNFHTGSDGRPTAF